MKAIKKQTKKKKRLLDKTTLTKDPGFAFSPDECVHFRLSSCQWPDS